MSVSSTSMGTNNFVTTFYNSTVVNESLRQEKITICKDAISVFHAEKSIATVANLVGRVLLVAAYHIPIVSLVVHAVATFFDHDTSISELTLPIGQAANQNMTIMAPDGTRLALTLPDSATIREVIQSFANESGLNSSLLSLFFLSEEEKLDENITLQEFMQAKGLSAINLDFFALSRRTDKEILLSLVEAGGAWENSGHTLNDIVLNLIDPRQPYQNNGLNWSEHLPLKDWDGVRTNDLEQIIGLELENRDLSGPIPEELALLENLEILNLSDSLLTGPIPERLGQLKNLQVLALSTNHLDGPIPQELGKLSNLNILELSMNRLSENIPIELGQLSELQELNLSNNEITGRIPNEFEQLSRLQNIFIDQTQISRPMPPEIQRRIDSGQITLA